MEPIAIYALRGVALVVILLAILAVTPRLGRARDIAIGDTLCRNGGYAGWSMDDGTPFASQAHCVRYVTEGGTVVSTPGHHPPDPGSATAPPVLPPVGGAPRPDAGR
jgi:hypothetical protein